jgi:Protein of unknown function (DUF2892)
MFATNVGTLDRGLRVVLGLALIAFAVFGAAEISWRWVGWIGVIPIATAIFGTCPLYSLLGISSAGNEGDA